MQIKSLFLAAAAATTAFAIPTSGGNSRVQGYPWSLLPWCMNDAQANWIVAQFHSILTNPSRTGAVATANNILANNYVETSDSINVLAGYPEGGPSFNGKQAYITGISYAQAIPSMTDLDIWHDCDTIGWQWLVNGLGRNVSPVKGFNKFIIDPSTGLVQSSDLEFNSVAWGEDIGGQWTPPPAAPSV